MKIDTLDGYVENPNDHDMNVGFTFWKCYVGYYNHNKRLPKFEYIERLIQKEQPMFGC